MRPDEIQGLTGVFKPNLIHEIRLSHQASSVQADTGRCCSSPTWSCSSSFAAASSAVRCATRLIEFVGDPLLFTQEPCLLKPDGRLIRRDAQKKSLGLSRELRSPRPGYDYSDVALQPQSQGHDRNVFVSKGVPCQRRPFLWVISQPVVEHLADLLRSGATVFSIERLAPSREAHRRPDFSIAHTRDRGRACPAARRARYEQSGMVRHPSTWQEEQAR